MKPRVAPETAAATSLRQTGSQAKAKETMRLSQIIGLIYLLSEVPPTITRRGRSATGGKTGSKHAARDLDPST